MGLKAAGTSGEFEKREIINENDLVDKKFLVERVGVPFTAQSKFKTRMIPIDVTVEGIGERVYFAQGTVIVSQIEESDGLVGLTLTVKWVDPGSGKNRYKVLEEVV